jgi:VanZ family protein
MATTMGMIFFLSHQPGGFNQLPQFMGADKLLHSIAYGILAGVFLYGLHPFIHDSNRAFAGIIVVSFCILYGISDEFHQAFIPDRFASAWDVAADCFGALIVVCVWYMQSAGKGYKNYS